jgi:hypothetical protein
MRVPGVVWGRYLCRPGQRIGPMENSTGRAGYVIIRGEDGRQVNERIREVYLRLGIHDAEGTNHLIDYSRESLHTGPVQ